MPCAGSEQRDARRLVHRRRIPATRRAVRDARSGRCGARRLRGVPGVGASDTRRADERERDTRQRAGDRQLHAALRRRLADHRLHRHLVAGRLHGHRNGEPDHRQRARERHLLHASPSPRRTPSAPAGVGAVERGHAPHRARRRRRTCRPRPATGRRRSASPPPPTTAARRSRSTPPPRRPAASTGTSSDGSPIVVSGLTNGITYTFTVKATNAAGASAASAAVERGHAAHDPGRADGHHGGSGHRPGDRQLHAAGRQRRLRDHALHRHLLARRLHRRPASAARSRSAG